MSNNVGVYFSANDAVYEWAVAFLNSFRAFNRDLRLVLIPFNDHCGRLLTLKEKYGFEVLADPAFSQLEAIGHDLELGLAPTGLYWFRRYAAFWGPFDEFMYLDCRIAVLTDLIPFVQAPTQYGFDLMHYDCVPDQVYDPGPLRVGFLRQHLGRSFISGIWASKKNVFTLGEFKIFAERALKAREQLNRRNTDQAFLNYCCDSKQIRYNHFAEVMGGICQNCWAGHKRKLYKKDGQYIVWDHGGLEHKKQLPFLHWAGIKLGPIMPYASIFLDLRLKTESFLNAALKRFWWISLYPMFKVFDLARRNRFLNILYHHLKKNSFSRR